MSDQFVDSLFEKLNVEREKMLIAAASAAQSRERVGEAARAWWGEFCEVLERKVHAWNAKDAIEARVTHTRTPSGSIRLWHRSAEVELSLAESRVVMTGMTKCELMISWLAQPSCRRLAGFPARGSAGS